MKNESAKTKAVNEKANKQKPCPFDCIKETHKGEWWGWPEYLPWLNGSSDKRRS
jgi:hypothetical protein